MKKLHRTFKMALSKNTNTLNPYSFSHLSEQCSFEYINYFYLGQIRKNYNRLICNRVGWLIIIYCSI